jgi:hypothetical protein
MLATDPELRAQMGSVGAQRAAAFGREAVATRIVALHELLLERASAS